MIREIKDYAKDIRDRAKLVAKYAGGEDGELSDSQLSEISQRLNKGKTKGSDKKSSSPDKKTDGTPAARKQSI